jgi:hypothetical protein
MAETRKLAAILAVDVAAPSKSCARSWSNRDWRRMAVRWLTWQRQCAIEQHLVVCIGPERDWDQYLVTVVCVWAALGGLASRARVENAPEALCGGPVLPHVAGRPRVGSNTASASICASLHKPCRTSSATGIPRACVVRIGSANQIDRFDHG